jgi:uncharacterized caspase-like protein
MTQNDVGLFFFSGHGAKDSDNFYYLLPSDCQGDDDLAVSAVPFDQVKSKLQATPGRVMLLLDSCHAGAAGGDMRKGYERDTGELRRELANDDYGIVTMCSSMGREFSLEDPQWGHGAFTKALIEGLEGQADANHDGEVTLAELDLFVTERVKSLTSGRQHAVTTRPTSIRDFPLAHP